eukprot:4489136-Amphidinium_carterae.1
MGLERRGLWIHYAGSSDRLHIARDAENSEFGHEWRDFVRRKHCSDLASRRPREFKELAGGVHAESLVVWRSAKASEVSAARRWHTGSYLTAERTYRHASANAKSQLSPFCPWCSFPVEETVMHVLRDCPRWSCKGRTHMLALESRTTQSVWKCGLIPRDAKLTPDEWRQVRDFQRSAYGLLAARD